MGLKEKIKENTKLKRLILTIMMHPVKTRPRWWLRQFRFLYMKRGRKSVVYRSVRKDIVPFNKFVLGDCSVVEDFSIINNAVGDVIIGDHSRIGLNNTIIGPVQIGSHVNLAQNITVSGLNHNFQDVEIMISQQGISTRPIVIESDVWIGANVVVLPGVTIGTHVVIAAGSVVVKDIPAYCVAVGNPAKVIKQYDFEQKKWIKVQ